jgi:hypothetical protein
VFKEMEKQDKGGSSSTRLHHGGLGRARLEAADPPAGRDARPDGQPSGGIIENPITSTSSATVLQYFVCARRLRPGHTALKTADSGYLTRRLMNVARTSSSASTTAAPWTREIRPIIESGEVSSPCATASSAA